VAKRENGRSGPGCAESGGGGGGRAGIRGRKLLTVCLLCKDGGDVSLSRSRGEKKKENQRAGLMGPENGSKVKKKGARLSNASQVEFKSPQPQVTEGGRGLACKLGGGASCDGQSKKRGDLRLRKTMMKKKGKMGCLTPPGKKKRDALGRAPELRRKKGRRSFGFAPKKEKTKGNGGFLPPSSQARP